MRHGVVAEGVAFQRSPPSKLRHCLRVGSHREECALRIETGKKVEHLTREGIAGPIIESEIDEQTTLRERLNTTNWTCLGWGHRRNRFGSCRWGHRRDRFGSCRWGHRRNRFGSCRRGRWAPLKLDIKAIVQFVSSQCDYSNRIVLITGQDAGELNFELRHTDQDLSVSKPINRQNGI